MVQIVYFLISLELAPRREEKGVAQALAAMQY